MKKATKYTVSVCGDVPADIAVRVSRAHANALRRGDLKGAFETLEQSHEIGSQNRNTGSLVPTESPVADESNENGVPGD